MAQPIAMLVSQCLLLVFVFVKSSISDPCPSPHVRRCLNGWQGWNGTCYINLVGIRKRANATLECHERGGRIATPNSREEYNFIWAIFMDSLGLSFGDNPGNGVWIGCTDIQTEGVWVCDGDTPQNRYRADWTESRDPNKIPPEERDCAVMSNIYPFWVAQQCSGWKNTVCERPVLPRPRAVRCIATPVDGRCIQGHIYKEIMVNATVASRLTSCCMLCARDWGCLSFNILGYRCQLNHATRYDVHAEAKHFLNVPGCAYYDIALEH